MLRQGTAEDLSCGEINGLMGMKRQSGRGKFRAPPPPRVRSELELDAGFWQLVDVDPGSIILTTCFQDPPLLASLVSPPMFGTVLSLEGAHSTSSIIHRHRLSVRHEILSRCTRSTQSSTGVRDLQNDCWAFTISTVCEVASTHKYFYLISPVDPVHVAFARDTTSTTSYQQCHPTWRMSVPCLQTPGHERRFSPLPCLVHDVDP